jgi:hypothetical protein
VLRRVSSTVPEADANVAARLHEISGSHWKGLLGPYSTNISLPPMSGVRQNAGGTLSGMSSGGRSGSKLLGDAIDGGWEAGLRGVDGI